MRQPMGEQISLDFFFGCKARADALRDVVEALLSIRGTLTGECLLMKAPGARDRRILHAWDGDSHFTTLPPGQIAMLLDDEDSAVIKLGVGDAFGISSDNPEVISFNGISPHAAQFDSNPICIVGEGWRFSTPGYEKAAATDGRQCWHLFKNLCEKLKPDYAAILNDDSLPSAHDLNDPDKTNCFRSFFISSSVYEMPVLRHVEALFSNVYTDMTESGLYVGTWLFSPIPLPISLTPHESYERSQAVSRLLAR